VYFYNIGIDNKLSWNVLENVGEIYENLIEEKKEKIDLIQKDITWYE
jgi:hypothetical protein